MSNEIGKSKDWKKSWWFYADSVELKAPNKRLYFDEYRELFLLWAPFFNASSPTRKPTSLLVSLAYLISRLLYDEQ